MKVVLLSQDGTVTRDIVEVLCSLAVPTLHEEYSCLSCGTAGSGCTRRRDPEQSGFLRRIVSVPPAHLELRALHLLARSCASDHSWARKSLDCDPSLWVSRATALLSLLASGPYVGFAGAPYAHMGGAFGQADWCTASILITMHDPDEWAASGTGLGEPICATWADAEDAFDLLECARRCTGSLRECLTTRATLATRELAAAFRRSQARLVSVFGERALRMNGSARVDCGARRCGKIPLRARIERFLHADAHQRACPTSTCTSLARVASTLDRPHVPSTARLPFYLHDFPGFRDVFAFFQERAVAGIDLDLDLPLSTSQYLTDIPLLRAFRHHPDRVDDPAAATLHVLRLPAHSSYAMASKLPDATGPPQHQQRMAAVTARVRQLRRVLPQDATLLVIMTFFYPQPVFGPSLLAELEAANTILATTDPDFAAHSTLFERAVVVPYRAMGRLETGAFRARGVAPWESRRLAYTLHADMSRADRGLRVVVRDALARFRVASGAEVSVRSVPLTKSADRLRSSQARQAARRRVGVNAQFDTIIEAALAATSTAMRNSMFCIAPAGDTLTSRRLFDALAAGCIPLVIRAARGQLAQHLPFARTIDWSRVAVFMTASETAGAACTSAALLALWRNATSASGRAIFKSMHLRGLAAFRRHLAVEWNSSGVVSAILSELNGRLGQVRAEPPGYPPHRSTSRFVTDRPRGTSSSRPIETVAARPQAGTVFVLWKHRLLVCISPSDGAVAILTANLVALVTGNNASEARGDETWLLPLLVNPAWRTAAIVETVGRPPRSCGGLPTTWFDTSTTINLDAPQRVAPSALQTALTMAGVSHELAEWAVGFSWSMRGSVGRSLFGRSAMDTHEDSSRALAAFDVFRQMYIVACDMTATRAARTEPSVHAGWPACKRRTRASAPAAARWVTHIAG